MRFITWTCALAVASAVVGCGSNGDTLATGTGSANPIENYKDQQMRLAMRGLSYETGLVTLTGEAAQIAKAGTAGQGAQLAAAADAIFQTNDFPAAIAAYTKAVIVAPNRAETYLGLSQALIAKGRAKESEAAVRTAIQLEPHNLDAHIMLARRVDMAGDSTKTIAAWNAVLNLDPEVAEAHGRIAIATYYQGDRAGALKHLKECERLGGEVPAQFKDMLLTEVRP